MYRRHPRKPPNLQVRGVGGRGASLLILPRLPLFLYNALLWFQRLSCLRLAMAMAKTTAEAIVQYDGQP